MQIECAGSPNMEPARPFRIVCEVWSQIGTTRVYRYDENGMAKRKKEPAMFPRQAQSKEELLVCNTKLDLNL